MTVATRTGGKCFLDMFAFPVTIVGFFESYACHFRFSSINRHFFRNNCIFLSWHTQPVLLIYRLQYVHDCRASKSQCRQSPTLSGELTCCLNTEVRSNKNMASSMCLECFFSLTRVRSAWTLRQARVCFIEN